MHLLKKISTVNFGLIIICFFLPFVAPMCSERKTIRNESDIDTLVTPAPNIDSPTQKSDSYQNDTISLDTISSSKKLEYESIPEKIYNFIISPDGKNLSGIGFIRYYFLSGLFYFSIPLSLLFAIIGLIRRINKKYISEKRMLLYTIIGLLGLIIFYIINESRDEIQYGFWITLILYTICTFINLRIYWIWRKLNNSK